MASPLSSQRRTLEALCATLEEAMRNLGEGSDLYDAPEERHLLHRIADDAERLALEVRHGLSGMGTTGELLPTRGPPVIVAVDEDPVSLARMRETLAPDFEVITSTNPREALELILLTKPDAVLSDLRLPVLDGMSMLELLHKDERTADIPCLFLTASGATQDLVRAFEGGAFDYMTKPIKPQEVAARLKHAVALSRERTEERAHERTDDLTGLPTRRVFRTELRRALVAATADRTPLSVAMVDHDGLKLINDRHGHAAGDRAIFLLAQAVRGSLRTGDLAARIGGDELGILMPGASAAGAKAVLERVRAQLDETPMVLGDVVIRLSMSFGIASLSETTGSESSEQLLRRADERLYEQKWQKRRDRDPRAARRRSAW